MRKAFGVTEQMVSWALNYNPQKGQSDLAKKIRSLALQRGGFVMVCAPASEVVHDAEDMMRQYFDSGWMWEANKNTGLLEVKNPQGETVISIEHAGIEDIEDVQQAIASLREAKA